mgnify:CR=1 FL=1
MEKIMEYSLLGAFLFYLISSVVFVLGITRKEENAQKKEELERKWGNRGILLAAIGAGLQLIFIILRILIGGHFPTSNLFEFTAFLCFAIVLAFIVISFLYRNVILGAFTMPLAVILLAYAAVFPTDVQPLIPALKSHWLYLHVTLAAIGQGAFAVGFAAGLVYLIHQKADEKKGPNAFFLEVVLIVICMFIAFIGSSFIFKSIGYKAAFEHPVDGQQVVQEYELPPIVGPYQGKAVQVDSFFGLSQPLLTVPAWMEGQNAASKLNSTLWSIFIGLLLYGIIRIITRKRLSVALYPLVRNIDPELVDEISYRSIAIGYPIFTLGALVFAMIWAHQAWGRFWGWDPKETWALITWLFYTAYLHLRLQRGWFGLKSSWLAVGGFVIIMINLILINLVISGLHSYA